MVTRRQRVRAFSWIAIVAMALTACGGGGGGPTEPSSASGSQSESEQGPLGVDIEKSTNGFDADTRELAPRLALGTRVVWRYVITNVGEGSLSEIVVTDDRLGRIRCGFHSLGRGERGVCTAEGTIRQSGLYRNVGTVRAVARISPTGFSQRVSDRDPSHYIGVERVVAQGCGLGYWKNHLSSWPPTGYSPSQTVESVFPTSRAFPNLASSTLLEALKFGGGPGAEGGAMILLRHAVASLLNAAHPRVSFSRGPTRVASQVNSALASGNRRSMLSLKDDLEAANEQECPLG